MGNDNSHENDRKRMHSELIAFSGKEKQSFEDLFKKLLSGLPKFTEELLQAHLQNVFSSQTISRIFYEMVHWSVPLPRHTTQTSVSETSFYAMVAHLLRGRVEQRAHVIRYIASTSHTKELNAKELFNFVKMIITAYYRILGQKKGLDVNMWDPGVVSPDSELEMLTFYSLNDLFQPDRKKRLSSEAPLGIPDCTYTDEELSKWLSHSLLFISCFNFVFQEVFPVCEQPDKSLLPLFVGKRGRVDHTNLLSVGAVMSINQAIPQKLREKWTLLFDSRRHGESFNNMLRNVRHHKNTVLVVRDTEGNVFGGFSTAVWSNHAAFQGSIDNFLFSLYPTVDIYRPSGINTNYFYLNTGQETFPNGMGMGGQFNYFGLWLDCEYGIGHSMAEPLSTTYQSPTISHQPQFKYTDLEVWKVSNIQEDLEEEEERVEKGVTSILDSDPGAKALLEMVGKGTLSDGLRESDPTASNPEETTQPIV